MSKLEPDMRDRVPLDLTAQEAECEEPPRRVIHLFGRPFLLPRSRSTRIAIGCVLIFLGFLGFLPVLGFWMIPLGLLVLSYEFARVRRWRRRSTIWWGNRKGRRYRARNGREP